MTQQPGVDPTALRMTMRQWVTGVTVVTSAADGFRAGMTVSSFTSVALEPPTVLVCLNKLTYTHKLVQRSGVYAVSMLGIGQEDVSNRFAGFDPRVTEHDQRFDGVELTTAVTDAPLIVGAVGWLDCKVIATHDTVTHTVFIAEVVFAQAFEGRQPLVYYNRSYQTLTPVQQPS
jgi:flavin reductase (DIM6/NTAB) family NADH-FMN oxidoreductase RutF